MNNTQTNQEVNLETKAYGWALYNRDNGQLIGFYRNRAEARAARYNEFLNINTSRPVRATLRNEE